MTAYNKDKNRQETPGEREENNVPPPGINVDENIGGTAHLNEEVGDEPATEKLQAELQELHSLASGPDEDLRQLAADERDGLLEQVLLPEWCPLVDHHESGNPDHFS